MEHNADRLELPMEMVWQLLTFNGEQTVLSERLPHPVLSGKLQAVGTWAPSAPTSPPIWSLACRGTKAKPEEVSFLYTLPDDSTHQLLQTHQDHHHLQEQPASASQSGRRSGPQNPALEATWDPLFHPGLCQGQGRKLKRLEVT